MKLLTKEIIEKLPKLGAQDSKDPKEVKIIVKFFDPTGSWTWYATEGQPVLDEAGNEIDFEFFGYVKGFENELGYFALNELLHAKDGLTGLKAVPIERDLHFGFDHILAEAMNGKV
jgi:hypothetical protein